MKEKIRVLMVDDEERFRKTTASLLEKRGFDTTIAENGEKAVELVKETPFDVVVLDIKMPGIDGLEALARIKEIRNETRVIMLTGHGTSDSARESLVKDAFDYLNKPCDIDILAAKIQDASSFGEKDQLNEKTAKEIMIHVSDYTRLYVDNTVKDAVAALMLSFNKLVSSNRLMDTGHRSILVFDRQDKIRGILSIMDLLKAIRPEYLSSPKPSMADSMQYSPMFWSGLFNSRTRELVRVQIGDIMSDNPLLVGEKANLMELADLMYTTRYRRLVVVENERVTGVVREQELFFEMARIIRQQPD